MSTRTNTIISSGISIVTITDEKLDKNIGIIQRYAAEAIEFYVDLLGFYPHESLTILPGDENPIGGCPVAEGKIKIHGVGRLFEKPADYWRWIVAHEVAHMYFGYYVYDRNPGAETKLGWLTLGLGLYLDKLFVDKKRTNCDFHERQVDAFKKAKQDGLPVSFDLSEAEIEKLDFDYNTVVLHGGSYYIINELADLAGEDRFIEILKKVLKDFKHKEIDYEYLRNFL